MEKTPEETSGELEVKLPEKETPKTWEEWEGDAVKYTITKKSEHTIEFEKTWFGFRKDQWIKVTWTIQREGDEITITMKESSLNAEEDAPEGYYTEDTLVQITYKLPLSGIFPLNLRDLDLKIKKYGVKATIRGMLEGFLSSMRSELEIDNYLADDC